MNHHPTPAVRRTLAGLLAAAALTLGLTTPTAGVAHADTTTPGAVGQPARAATGNQFATHPWGTYQGPTEIAWPPYDTATGDRKARLATIALAPKATWFGAWIPDNLIADRVHKYIANATGGDPDVLVQMTIFRMVPWEHEACTRLPTHAETTSYKRWIDSFAAAVGGTHAAIILQPDGPFALCAPGGSTVPSQLVRYATHTLSANPNTSVYIEAGAADWPAPGPRQGGVASAVKILTRGGISEARGFALNGTHYSDTNLEVARGAAIIAALNAQGITGKHFVVNTSSNGHPFEFGKYTGPDSDNAFVCKTPHDVGTCITLGIPATSDVTNPKWRMSAVTNQLAGRYVDAYLWFGRPWLYRQAAPFKMNRALALDASNPYAGLTARRGPH